jgi:hypothetical protein
MIDIDKVQHNLMLMLRGQELDPMSDDERTAMLSLADQLRTMDIEASTRWLVIAAARLIRMAVNGEQLMQAIKRMQIALDDAREVGLIIDEDLMP